MMTNTFLWIGTVGMALGGLAFMFLGVTARSANKQFYYITALIPLIAACAYLAMAEGQGAVMLGSRTFYFARYIDWIVTTPLLLLDLALLALVPSESRNWRIFSLVSADLFMIVTGLISGLSHGQERYVWLVVSCVAFAVVLYVLAGQMFAEARERAPQVGRLFRQLSTLTIALWTLYPVVFFLGTEGTGTITLTAEVGAYMVLDLLAKVGFGSLLLGNRAALEALESSPEPATIKPRMSAPQPVM